MPYQSKSSLILLFTEEMAIGLQNEDSDMDSRNTEIYLRAFMKTIVRKICHKASGC